MRSIWILASLWVFWGCGPKATQSLSGNNNGANPDPGSSTTDPFLIQDKDALEYGGGQDVLTSRQVTFTVNASDLAQDMRFSRRADLADATWVPVTPNFDYTFDSLGFHYFYIQFRAADETLSEIYEFTAQITPFGLSDGDIAINNDSAITTSTTLSLSIVVPSNATEMKVFATGEEAAASWEAPATTKNFVLNQGGDSEVSVRFRDAEANTSPLYSDTIYIELFPLASLSFTLNQSTVSTTRNANLTSITATSFANEMMISGRESFKDATWQAFSASVVESYSFCDPTNTVWMKFRHSASGYVSETISESGSIACGSVPASSCDDLAEDKFLVNIAPNIQGCPGCHTNGTGGMTLRADEHTLNRTNLMSFINGDPDRFFDKMNGNTGHSGGIYPALTSLRINTWFNAEDACP